MSILRQLEPACYVDSDLIAVQESRKYLKGIVHIGTNVPSFKDFFQSDELDIADSSIKEKLKAE